jgi:hypothetical protein
MIRVRKIRIPPVEIDGTCGDGKACVDDGGFINCVTAPAEKCTEYGAKRCRDGIRERCVRQSRNKAEFRENILYWEVAAGENAGPCPW